MDTVALQKMDEKTMLARISMGKFPQDLTVTDKKLLAQVAITYGFDPLMGEVSIYQGRPYVSIDGRYRSAQETNELDGVETRPATKQEREDWAIPEGDFFFRAEIYKKGCQKSFVGWGRVIEKETTGGKGFKPVETNPQRMAEKRAEAQALRKAFHIPLPSYEDIGSENGQVDIQTGEIIEAEVIENPPQAAVQPKEQASKAKKVVGDGDNDLAWQKVRLLVMPLYQNKVEGWNDIEIIKLKMQDCQPDIVRQETLEETYNQMSDAGKKAFVKLLVKKD